MRRLRPARAALGAAAAITVLAGCGPGGHHGPAGAAAAPAARYYLSLGDSLAQGVQADPLGHSGATSRGYADQLYDVLRRGDRGLRLVKLGCPGETTGTMIRGRHCVYPAGSQLSEAVAVLREHRGHVPLVTLDIGANDAGSCFTDPVHRAVPPCRAGPRPPTMASLRRILARLRAAAGPPTVIIGMTLYAPELPEWRYGPGGRRRARLSEQLTLAFDTRLARVYRSSGARVADVAGAFRTADFTGAVPVPGLGLLPRNVAAICAWTWVCARPPRGPNKHPDEAGYGVIARAYLAAYQHAYRRPGA
jgi:lysophospholipase L1-like esterase